MLSLNARLLVAATTVLVAFLGLTGLALDRAFRQSAVAAAQERLQAQVYMLLGAADVDASAQMVIPDVLPEARFSTPGSGLYAWVIEPGGDLIWRSSSLLGMRTPAITTVPPIGNAVFEQLTPRGEEPMLALGFTVSWEVTPESPHQYTFWVVETRQGLDLQVQQFRRSLGVWFLAAALVLLLVQGVILRWSLRPLRRVAAEVTEIEAGQRESLTGDFPRELRPLTRNLNAFIHDSRTRLERYRHALADLAHSLKTPLAVINSALQSDTRHGELERTVAEQVARMNQAVDYQLQRAAASGHTAMAAPVPVAPTVQKILDSLAKVYADKRLVLTVEIAEGLKFRGDQGDLMEIVGNLADNACKWARSQVILRADCDSGARTGAGLTLEVEDDGPGIAMEMRQIILGRGQRADPSTVGHGIGLAVVRDLVEEVYQGNLELATGVLGGARVRICL